MLVRNQKHGPGQLCVMSHVHVVPQLQAIRQSHPKASIHLSDTSKVFQRAARSCFHNLYCLQDPQCIHKSSASMMNTNQQTYPVPKVTTLSNWMQQRPTTRTYIALLLLEPCNSNTFQQQKSMSAMSTSSLNNEPRAPRCCILVP